jgi:hypothetical protein
MSWWRLQTFWDSFLIRFCPSTAPFFSPSRRPTSRRPTNARYKGCTYFCDQCNSIEFKGIIENVRRRILYRLNNPEQILPGKEIRIKVDCPAPNFPEKIKRPRVEVLALSLVEANPENPATLPAVKSSILNQVFGLKNELQDAGLDLIVKRGVLTKVVMGESTHTDSFFFRCPKLLSEA